MQVIRLGDGWKMPNCRKFWFSIVHAFFSKGMTCDKKFTYRPLLFPACYGMVLRAAIWNHLKSNFTFCHRHVRSWNRLSGWWFGTCCYHILGIIIPTDFHIVQRGRYTTNQLCSCHGSWLSHVLRRILCMSRRPWRICVQWTWRICVQWTERMPVHLQSLSKGSSQVADSGRN